MIFLSACVQPESKPATLQPTPKIIPSTGIKRGINLGNWLEAPIPGEWGVTIQPQHFTAIRQAGFDSVRIPVRFSSHADPHAPYTLDPLFMQLLDEAIQQALQNDLNVILDFHHYDHIMQAPTQHTERFLAIWQQLAERYQNAPNTVYFELLNELHGKMDEQGWNQLLQLAIERIRLSNPQRWIIVGGTDYNHIGSLDGLRLPEDDFLIATFHFYEPFQFTHQGANWVAGAEKWNGLQWAGTIEEKQSIKDVLDKATEWSQRNGIPLLMGEFGVIAGVDAGSRQAWTAFVANEAYQRDIAWVYWDLCAEFRVYDCQKDEWDQALLAALMAE